MNKKLSTRQMTLAAMFAALTAVGAYLSIPVTAEVPFTLQIFFVLLSGSLLGAVGGALSQITYLALGLIFPVYAGGGVGLGHLLGPRGGYLWGFVAAAFIVGVFAEHFHNKSGWTRLLINILGMMLGLTAIYAGGIIGLMLTVGYSRQQAFAVGVAPFMLLDSGKAVMAALMAARLQKLSLV